MELFEFIESKMKDAHNLYTMKILCQAIGTRATHSVLDEYLLSLNLTLVILNSFREFNSENKKKLLEIKEVLKTIRTENKSLSPTASTFKIEAAIVSMIFCFEKNDDSTQDMRNGVKAAIEFLTELQRSLIEQREIEKGLGNDKKSREATADDKDHPRFQPGVFLTSPSKTYLTSIPRPSKELRSNEEEVKYYPILGKTS